MKTRRSLLLVLPFVATAATLWGGYAPPGKLLAETPIVVRSEPDAPLNREAILGQLTQVSGAFRSLQLVSPATGLVDNHDALNSVEAVIRDSLGPMLPKDAAPRQQLIDRSRQSIGNTFGYSVVAFPEVHIWTKPTLKLMLEGHDSPPWVTLDKENGTLNFEFIREDGTLYPLIVIVDPSLSEEARSERLSGFLDFWLQTMRAAQDRVSATYIFRVIQQTSEALLSDKRVPAWLAVGLSYRIAHTAASRLFGEQVASEAVDSLLEPARGEKDLRAALPALLNTTEGSLSKRDSRVAYDFIVTAQADSNQSFVRRLLSTIAKNDRRPTPEEVKRLYSEASSSKRSLLDH
jgi:hypothetical protein